MYTPGYFIVDDPVFYYFLSCTNIFKPKSIFGFNIPFTLTLQLHFPLLYRVLTLTYAYRTCTRPHGPLSLPSHSPSFLRDHIHNVPSVRIRTSQHSWIKTSHIFICIRGKCFDNSSLTPAEKKSKIHENHQNISPNTQKIVEVDCPVICLWVNWE